MASADNKETIKITLDDLASVTMPDAAVPYAAPPAAPGAKTYGSIASASDQSAEVSEERGRFSFVLQAWFYLGSAGLLGAIVGWAICEPAFVDGQGHRWGNNWMLPMILMFMCLGFGVAESLVERSTKKALIKGAMALPLGIVFGFIFSFVANIIYGISLGIISSAGVQSYRNPAAWIVRGVAWMVFGVAGGVVYGIIGQSAKKAKFGVLGGIIGAGLGGMLFDPIIMLGGANAAMAPISRVVGFALFGVATGLAMGLVESALKDRWLYVTAGPLAGKQFILYKTQTVIGSLQQSDIYLFKDPGILPQHAVIDVNGSRVQMRALGNVCVSGQPAATRILQDGDLVQIGRYSFRYKEKHRS